MEKKSEKFEAITAAAKIAFLDILTFTPGITCI